MPSPIITPDLVDLGLEAPDRQTATRQLAQRLAARGRVTDLDGFLADVTAREQQMPTGIEGGIGIPHARSAFVTEPTLAFARSTAGVEVRNRERFAGKPLVVAPVKRAINDGPGLVAEAVQAAEAGPAASSPATPA